jgi:hypothetical protein
MATTHFFNNSDKILGLTNASIEKELTWLRTNCGF